MASRLLLLALLLPLCVQAAEVAGVKIDDKTRVGNAELKEAKKGMAITLDWNGTDTRLLAQGKPVGQPITGEDFYRALLRIWIGDKPVQDDLKKALLGGG